MCLSRDFTAKIGGYLSADWSHMLFRTCYGTKVTIKSERLAKNHIEPYCPSTINVISDAPTVNIERVGDPVAVIRDSYENSSIPDVLLREWAEENIVDSPSDKVVEASMGNYVIHEFDAVIPKLEKGNTELFNQQNELLEMYFDGSCTKNGAGGGAMLISPSGERYYSAFHFAFSCTNNIAEYEGLIVGLEWARKHGISLVKVYGDSELVVN